MMWAWRQRQRRHSARRFAINRTWRGDLSCRRGRVPGGQGGISSALMRSVRDGAGEGIAPRELVGLTGSFYWPRGQDMGHIRRWLEICLVCGLPAVCLALVLRRCILLVLLHRHALAILSLKVLEALGPMAVLRGRGLLRAVTVLVGHLGRGPRSGPRCGLNIGHGRQTSE